MVTSSFSRGVDVTNAATRMRSGHRSDGKVAEKMHSKNGNLREHRMTEREQRMLSALRSGAMYEEDLTTGILKYWVGRNE